MDVRRQRYAKDVIAHSGETGVTLGPVHSSGNCALGTLTRAQRAFRLVHLILPATASAIAVWLFQLGWPISATVPDSGDLPGHLYAIQHLISESLPRGRILDWSHRWFGGFPTFYFYFPLPALLVAILSLAVPVPVALKVVVVIGPAVLPWAVYYFLRSLGSARIYASFGAFAVLGFLAMVSYKAYGGNVLSSLSGEFSYSVGFSLSLVYLASIARASRGLHVGPWPSILLAATALSHVIPVIAAAVGSASLLRSPRMRVLIVRSWVVGFLLSGFWALPFLVRSPYMGKFEWSHAPDASELFPLEIVLLFPLAAVGLAAVTKEWKSRWVIPVALLLIAFVSYLLPHDFFHPARLIPYWFLGVNVLAGISIAHILTRRSKQSLLSWVAVSGVTVTCFLLLVLARIGLLTSESERVMAGMESSAVSGWRSYASMYDALDSINAGRVIWEPVGSARGQLVGSNHAMWNLTYRSSKHSTATGLLRESSHSAPFMEHLLASLGGREPAETYRRLISPVDTTGGLIVDRMRFFGIQYLITSSAEGTRAARETLRLRELKQAPTWSIFQVPNASLVDVPAFPLKIVQPGDFSLVSKRWFDSFPPTSWVVRDAYGLQEALDMQVDLADVATREPVTRIELGYRRISFRTEAIGVPHLVKVSSFPNWRATGASGPFLAAPSFMAVVPTQHHVQLDFEDTWVEILGRILSLCGLAAILLQPYRSIFSRTDEDRTNSARKGVEQIR